MEGKGTDDENPSSIASAFKRLTQRSKAPSAGFFGKRRNKKAAVPGTVRQSPAVVRGATYPPRYEAPETSGAGGYVGSRCVGRREGGIFVNPGGVSCVYGCVGAEEL